MSIVAEDVKQPVTIVPQSLQPVSQKRETVIVSAKGEDISKWRKYAAIYYNRSVNSKEETTRNSNRVTYEHYRELLEAAGYNITEGVKTITIHEPGEEAAA